VGRITLMQNPWYVSEILWTITAVIGGIARVLDSYVRTGIVPKLSLLFAHALVSGFSGYMVAQVVQRFDPSWAHVAAGVGGYLGTQGLDWIASLIAARFGGRMDTRPNGHPGDPRSPHAMPPPSPMQPSTLPPSFNPVSPPGQFDGRGPTDMTSQPPAHVPPPPRRPTDGGPYG